MNERFKTLWFEAAESKNGNSWEEQTEFMKKFAELIVRECIEIAREEEGHSPFEGPVETKIKLYFGVEL